MTNHFEPQNLSEIIGHQELINQDGIVYRLLKKKILTNLLFYGPSGIGKTTLVKVLVHQYKQLEVLDFNPLIDKKELLVEFLKKSSLFKKVVVINEIHNLSKDKQDILLEALQQNFVYLFATTNMNPYAHLNNALLSRCLILKMQPVKIEEIKTGLKNILKQYNLKVECTEIIELLIVNLHADLRKLINMLFLILDLYGAEWKEHLDAIKTLIQNNQTFNSAKGDEFHDLKSAFHKSLRGSDPDAALYYLYQLMQTGDYQAIYRRLLACCYEDVGLANPNMAIKTMTAINACIFLGEKESFQILAYITIDLALSPKSNSAMKSLVKARNLIEKGHLYEMPNYLKHGSLTNDILHPEKFEYLFPHDFTNNWVKQQYLPNELKNFQIYTPNKYSVYEQKIQEYWKKIKQS